MMNLTLISLVFSPKRQWQWFDSKVVESHIIKKGVFKLYCAKLCHHADCLVLRVLPKGKFLKFLQNSQESTCVKVFFINVADFLCFLD